MKKEGFTLIELLAVIAILALLVVIAIPTVLKLFKEASEKTFVAQAQNLYKAAEQEYATNIIKGTEINRYFYSEEVEENKLNTSGSKGVYYDIEVESGKIKKITVSNEKYSINIENEEKVNITDITIEKLSERTEAGYIDVGSGETYAAAVYGVYWDGTSTSTLTRTDDAVGLTYTRNTSTITSDFDEEQIYREMTEVTDEYGNVFIKIPKFYIKKTVSGNTWKWQISKQKKDSLYYLPACFKEESTGEVYPYILVGKYNASLSSSNKLESKSGKEVLVSKNITQFRDYAESNGSGYQILDIHTIDVLQTLFTIEYATLDSTSVMYGFASGSYVATDTIQAINGNTLTMPAGRAAVYVVGQLIDIGTSLGGRQISRNLRITDVNTGDNTITYEVVPGISVAQVGATPISTGQIVYNVSYLTGTTDTVNTASGSPTSNTTGKYAMKYRGIENLYGNVWQFVDGINIRDRVSYVARDAKEYAVNTFTGAYIQVGYTNASANNYVIRKGYDSNNPFINLPTNVDVIGNSAYKDYYYQDIGDRMAIFGGAWSTGTYSGLSNWNLNYSSTSLSINFGSRLLKTPL